MKILVTGGAGYIGSHTCVELLNAGYEVIVMDNLSNSKPESLNRVRQITGKPLSFYRADILDRAALHEIFTANEIEAVIHFAGLKAVGESVSFPLSYYQNKDYPTKDGTGVRDYIHVADLACGHVKALEKVMVTTGVETYNLGTGRGYSVLEMVDAFEQASGRKIPFRISGRRAGDVGISYANPLKAQRELGWIAEKGINEMCKDTWRWQSNNPQGYDSNHIHYITNAQTVVNYEESL
ncbi:NAD-dependent epimerase/dehydratase family protein [Siminovitchia fortis]|uniref:NAD-dependent epimerase/dehydratase family protein n=1 Tax=Siminovitchia fortis TaxID=254758 RepID=UPI0011A05CA2|nr:SDR family NAD(P)-dependent oxidoreductase [Siminovitchia fortis]